MSSWRRVHRREGYRHFAHVGDFASSNYCLQAVRPQTRIEDVVDYTRLPPPVKYEELQRESLSESFFSNAFDRRRVCTCTASNGTAQ